MYTVWCSTGGRLLVHLNGFLNQCVQSSLFLRKLTWFFMVILASWLLRVTYHDESFWLLHCGLFSLKYIWYYKNENVSEKTNITHPHYMLYKNIHITYCSIIILTDQNPTTYTLITLCESLALCVMRKSHCFWERFNFNFLLLPCSTFSKLEKWVCFIH